MLELVGARERRSCVQLKKRLSRRDEIKQGIRMLDHNMRKHFSSDLTPTEILHNDLLFSNVLYRDLEKWILINGNSLINAS